MRSLHASYNDGLHSVSFITHKDNPDRQTTIGIHTTASFSIDPDDSIALQMNIVSEDGTPANVGIFGITLEQLSDAVSTALQEKHASKSEPA